MKYVLPISLLVLTSCGGRRGHTLDGVSISEPPASVVQRDAPASAPRPPVIERTADPTPTSAPPPEPTIPRETADAVVTRLNHTLEDAFFDYDRSEMRADAIAALQKDAALLAPLLPDFSQLRVVIEGHCDERGSAGYNLGLGDRRAQRAADFLVSLGILRDRIQVISYGKEMPQCIEPEEPCWRRNRRAHITVDARRT